MSALMTPDQAHALLVAKHRASCDALHALVAGTVGLQDEEWPPLLDARKKEDYAARQLMKFNELKTLLQPKSK